MSGVQLEPTTYESGPATLATSGTAATEGLVPMRPQSNTPDDLHYLFMDRFQLWSEYTDAVDKLHRAYLSELPLAGYIYFAELDGRGSSPHPGYRVKIGRTRDIKARLSQLNKFPVIMPFSVSINTSFWAENAPEVEAVLHAAFREYRISGEWFSLPFEVMHAFYDVWYADDYDGHTTFHSEATGDRYSLESLLEETRQYLEVLRERQNRGRTVE